MNLALFDFDGTITNQDAFTKFLFYATPKSRTLAGFIIASPVIGLYKLGLLPARYTRPILAKVAFWHRSVEQVDALASKFVSEYLPTVLRPEAIAALNWHKQQGDRIYLISASLNPYLDIWGQQQGIEVICSRLAIKKGRYTGSYVDGDCSLDNKVRLLKKRLVSQQITLNQFDKIYAYGDTYEDIPMLELADEKMFNWQKVTNTEQIQQRLAK
ncbi:HAD-IB family hydrolase [Vibrio panuliri]|uniref:Phosphoserine phosphatase n=1 Tax=Vibrio panuliri TaxID=1381081 RepID=A0ABX3FP23_9VIBR|nr:HAD-IB family hydrolase [Vibrio panuliri]KAB1457891.1 HAD-IB family hydrolase [Vibrio panuliri]OLQ94483.1 phosphoserine phosphatase [Vibrio panuliri]